MKRMLIAAALLSCSAVNAQPYATVGLLTMTPEVSAGYATRWLDLEAGVLGEYQIGSINAVATFDEWTVRGNRLTARLRAPITDKLELLPGASAYDVKYQHKRTATATESRKERTWGASIGVKYRLNKRVSAQAEQVYIDTPREAFGLPDVRATRIGLSFSF